MKILSVTLIPPGEDAQWWRIVNIANRLRSSEVEVSLVHYIIKGFESFKKIGNYSKNQNSIIIDSAIKVPFRHLQTLGSNKYDIVYGNTCGGAFFCILGKFKKTPLILDMHGISDEFLILENKPQFCKLLSVKLMETVSLHFSDKIICVSKSMIKHLNEKRGIPLNKLAYATNGVDLEFFKQVNPDIVRNMKHDLRIENKFIFGYIGGFQGYQGIGNFIKAAKSINSDKVAFLIVGGNENLRENNLIYISKVPRDQIPSYYSLCDILVLPRPSHIAAEVAAPTKFSEYCAMAKPILTTNVGDAADLVKRYKNGIVVEDNSPEVLKRGIYEFLKVDPDLLSLMGKNSRKLAENEFDWNIISNNIFSILKEFQ